MSDQTTAESHTPGIGSEIDRAMRAATGFLDGHDTEALLARVGRTIEELPQSTPVDKTALQDSYGGSQIEPCDDFLAGRGMFYITEQRRLRLDCTGGHYQMAWGYNDPGLVRAATEAVSAGIAWDGHCNIPQTPVKLLAHRLVEAARGASTGLDTVNLGCCTGSVACGTALKIQLRAFEQRAPETVPVIVVLDGSYHGTDMVGQYLRGMWTRYVTNLEVAAVQANDVDELRKTFKRFGGRVAAFWSEPILMNREVIPVEASYLQAARSLCDKAGALMCIDEIQTGFWQPEVFAFRTLGFVPDMVVAGKGMTGGFHPQAAVVFRSGHDTLAQYDAISTNGSAPLPCYMALCCMDRLAAEAEQINATARTYEAAMHAVAADFPRLLQDARGRRHMMGLKFHEVDTAIDFHRRAVAAGLWIRVHAYHEGHSTVLTKLPLVADERIVDFLTGHLRQLLEETPA